MGWKDAVALSMLIIMLEFGLFGSAVNFWKSFQLNRNLFVPITFPFHDSSNDSFECAI